jgi:hypothetical protein
VLVKNGDTVVAVMEPVQPLAETQAHPVKRNVPTLGVGHATAEQEPLRKGKPTTAETLPENPALQLQPEGTLVPVELEGQGSGVHE